MRFQLPADTAEFAAVLSRHAAALKGSDADALFAGLDGLGVLDLLTDDSPDPDNKQLNTVVALEQLATAGLFGAFAETIWARGFSPDARQAKAFVGVPSSVGVPGRVLVPHGRSVSGLVRTDGTLELVPATAWEKADIKVQKGHAWYASAAPTGSFEQLAGPFVWRANAALTLGYMEACLAMVLAHAQSRTQFKRTLASFQAVQFRLSECRWRLSGLQLLVREAAWRADREDGRATPISALAWLHARQVGRIVTANVHQLYGAIGFTDELGVAAMTGATTFLRVTAQTKPATDAVWAARPPVGDDPPSNVLGGFRAG